MPEQPPTSPFDQLIGTEWVEIGPEQARARIEVEKRHTQPYGLVHGGVFTTLAESICSRATSEAVREQGKVAVGLANSASFLRPVSDGHLNARARRRHAGRTTWIWDVELSDDQGRLCALVRMTIAIRDAG
jgi:1,4-dihydroxy-2-naphthoyl-CoA hydrolase